MTISTLFLCFAAGMSDTHRVLPADMHVVEGVVLDTNSSRASSYLSKIRINRVYGPEEDLVGREFLAYSADPKFIGNATRLVIPRLRVGERGIWVVERWHGEIRYVHLYNYARWPTREAGTGRGAPPFEAAKQFAEAVERVSKLHSADDAAAALKRLTTDANPYISSWAISRLPAVSRRSTEADEFLHRLVENAKVPIQGQVQLDRVLLGQNDGSILVERHDPEWQHSEARLKLFRRWFNGAPSERDAQLVVSRLDSTTQHPEQKGFSQEYALRLVALLVRNENFPLSERQNARTIMLWAAQRYEDGDEKVFETAVELVSSDLPDRVRGHIAGVFARQDFSLDEKRRMVLTKLRDAEKSEAVAEMLENALARPNGEPERPFGVRRGSKRTQPSSPPNRK